MFTGYRITSPYGWRIHPMYGTKKFHTGIDLVKRHKSPIYPFVPGRVTFSAYGVSGSGYGGFGNVVEVRDKYGYNHAYCHLHLRHVSVGKQVTVEKSVGLQGNTGVSRGSHLHYEVRRGGFGTHINPVEYLKGYFEKEAKKVQTCQVYLDNTLIGEGVLHEGRAYLPVRTLEKKNYAVTGWDGDSRTVYLKSYPERNLNFCDIYLDGALLAQGILWDGKSFIPIRDLEGVNYRVDRWDGNTNSVYLIRR